MTQITEKSAYIYYTGEYLNPFQNQTIMLTEPPPDDPHFIQAAQEWDLDRLYHDIKHCISEKLTDREKLILKGLLSDYSPKEIAKIAYGKDTSETIAATLTNLYEILTHLNAHQSSDPTKIAYNNIRRILKSLGYCKSFSTH
jgi:DNA-binding CsgD family transcriptional regulator